MTAQILDRTLTAYRIGDPAGRYGIMDPTGSTLFPGRWNTPASPMIYSSEHYSTAMLEKLVHGGGMLPPNQHFVTITINAGAKYEVFSLAHNPGWESATPTVAQGYGEDWFKTRRSLLLIVPSVVARPERNILINAAHPDFIGNVTSSLHEPVYWDNRLFNRP